MHKRCFLTCWNGGLQPKTCAKKQWGKTAGGFLGAMTLFLFFNPAVMDNGEWMPVFITLLSTLNALLNLCVDHTMQC
jgi:hypothetical protein